MLRTTLILTMLTMTSFTTSCGDDEEEKTTPATTSTPTYTEAAAIVTESCYGSTCHAGTASGRANLSTQAGLDANATAAKAHLQAGTMPKSPETITEADKTTLLNYLESVL